MDVVVAQTKKPADLEDRRALLLAECSFQSRTAQRPPAAGIRGIRMPVQMMAVIVVRRTIQL
jgi:hypothetical protein